LATVYFGNYIFTNLIHVTTNTTKRIMATVLEKALTTLYAVISVNVNSNDYEKYIKIKFVC